MQLTSLVKFRDDNRSSVSCPLFGERWVQDKFEVFGHFQ